MAKIGEENLSLTTLSPQKGRNGNAHIYFEEDEGLLYSFFNILIKYGHGITGMSFTLGKTQSGEGKTQYFIKKTILTKRVYAVIYALICLYWFVKATGEKNTSTNFRVINWIKRGIHVILITQLIVMKYYLEKAESHSILLTMLREADILQAKFAKCKISFPRKKQVRMLACFIMGTTGLWSWIQTFLYLTASEGKGMKRFARLTFRFCTLGLVDAEEYLKPPMINFLGFIGVIVDTIPTTLFHFGNAIWIFSILSIWIIFQRLTKALEPCGVLESESLARVMDLHLSATRILHLMNELFSSLIFVITLYTILQACYWANTIIAAQEFSRTYIVALFFVVKNAFMLLMAADVNSKAHRITFWLEKYASGNPLGISTSGVDSKAMSIWTCQLYNKETIGFKGLNYFTITSCFISATVGLIITYTAVVVQFLEMEKNPIIKS